MKPANGTVYLVGAGCASADLVTLRALRLLQQCDALVYDDLLDPALLDHVPSSAEKHYVGKREGQHSLPQTEINELLVSLAARRRLVVRLKGGDPFVFGRGGEEALALQAAGVPFEVVPGVTSAVAVPELAGIPVTHRGVSRGFHVVTGHTASDVPSERYETLAALEGTLVFLMGLHRAGEIARGLITAGKDPQTPAALLSAGSAPRPAVVRVPLQELAQHAARFPAPALILVGEAAALELSAPLPLPLQGVRVGLLGTASFAARLEQELHRLGAETVRMGRMDCVPLPLDLSFSRLSEGENWVVLTSANGVEQFFARLNEQKLDLRALSLCRFAVIGKATAAALAAHGIYADLCPASQTSEGLVQALLERLKGRPCPVRFFRALQASPHGMQALAQAGCPVESYPLYTLQGEVFPPERAALRPVDWLAFGSAGAVDCYLDSGGLLPEGVRCLCIGPVTAAALHRRSTVPVVTADEISAAGMARALLARHTEDPPAAPQG